jgi:nicotinate-nucleotide--dimethylbenzimidazole phosphoribosyltransferase
VPDNPLESTVAAIRPPDAGAAAAARDLQARLTKPVGSLGALEELGVRLAALAGACPPPLPAPAAVAIFAGDHGVHVHGVTPWPQEVTAQMVGNFLAGTAVVNAFAREVGASVTVVDVGVTAPLERAGAAPLERAGAAPLERAGAAPLERAGAAPIDHPQHGTAPAGPGPAGDAHGSPTGPRLLHRRVRAGTGDFTTGPAMSRADARAAVTVGIEVAGELIEAGAGVLITGDMGIGNTTAAAALIAAFTAAAPAATTGRGTGIDDVAYARKVGVVTAGLNRHSPTAADPLATLAAVGGLEHAALAGFVLGAAAHRVPVILDGVNAVAAALAAAAFAPDAVGAMVAGHRSAEPGATVGLAALGLTPLVDLGLRLGEATGALMALPLVAGAARVLREVATFDSAGVTPKSAADDGPAGPAVEAGPAVDAGSADAMPAADAVPAAGRGPAADAVPAVESVSGRGTRPGPEPLAGGA